MAKNQNLKVSESAAPNGKPLDIAELMLQIKAEARKELARDLASSGSGPQSSPLRVDELNYLNKNYTYPDSTLDPATVSSHWPVIGPAIAAARKFFYKIIRQKLFFNYFTEEREFQSNLVRCLNELARAINDDQLRLSEDHVQSLVALEDELRELLNRKTEHFHQQIASQNNQKELLSNRLQTVEQVVAGLEVIISRVGKRTSSSEQEVTIPDYQYLLLENRFRGSEEEISRRVAVYLPELKNVPGTVCEIGSGRGELQSLLKNTGVSSFGVELDEAMIEHCLEKGLDVRKADGIKYLAEMEDNSLGAVIALQVIEHLPVSVLKAFFEVAAKKVKPGGKVIVETINVASLQALRANYFRDPTHAQPLHPDTTSYIMQQAGLKVNEIRYLSPFPETVLFETSEISPEFPPRFREAVEKMNRNASKLNEIFFGNQDYAVIAEVE